jgi:hypothetical protein
MPSVICGNWKNGVALGLAVLKLTLSSALDPGQQL